MAQDTQVNPVLDIHAHLSRLADRDILNRTGFSCAMEVLCTTKCYVQQLLIQPKLR